MKKTMTLMLLLLCGMLKAEAQKSDIRELSGEHLYYSDRNMSESEARFEAINDARVHIMAKEFGTIIENYIHDDSQHSFQLMSNEVKGEFIADIDEPVVEHVERQDGGINVWKVKVKFTARPLSNQTNFKAQVLKNGVEPKFESQHFKTNDDLYVLFEAPVDGYVAIYVVDEGQIAQRCLPYQADYDGEQPVKGHEKYVFFSPRHNKTDVPEVDELVMTCGNAVREMNRIYIIFSPNRFALENDRRTSERLPSQLTYKEFSQWISRSMGRDERMGRVIVDITVENREK